MRCNKWRAMLGITGWLLMGSMAQASAPEGLDQQRQVYAQAQKALQQGRISDYRRLKRKLTEYPLYPYLEYAEMSRRLSRTQSQQVQKFIEHNKEIYLKSTGITVFLCKNELSLQHQ